MLMYVCLRRLFSNTKTHIPRQLWMKDVDQISNTKNTLFTYVGSTSKTQKTLSKHFGGQTIQWSNTKNTPLKHIGKNSNTKNTLLKHVGPTSNTDNTLSKHVGQTSNTENTFSKHVGPTSNNEKTLSKRGGGQTQPALYLITLTGGSLQVEKCGIPLGQFFSHKICVMLVVKLLILKVSGSRIDLIYCTTRPNWPR